MPFQADRQLAAGIGGQFGEYLITFISEREQVRAISFAEAGSSRPMSRSRPDSTRVALRTLTSARAWNYAREHGFPDQFRVVLS